MIDAACRRQRDALVDFVERGERRPGTDDALAHLERCRRCEVELADVALVVAALRRLGRDAAQATPPPDSWWRLRERILRSRDAARRATWAWRLRVGTSMVGVLLVAAVLSPGIGVPIPGVPAVLPESRAYLIPELRAEAAYIAAVGVQGPTRARARANAKGGSVIVNYPDGIRPKGKEVRQEGTERWPLSAS